MQIFPFEDLQAADLQIDAVFQGGRSGHSGDDPLPRLLGVSNQGGFRYLGSIATKLEMVVLITTFDNVDWPDSLDRETGVFTYYGDNKRPGRVLHKTGRGGNELLSKIFTSAHAGAAGRQATPPIFLFGRQHGWRDATFLGLATPGTSDLAGSEDLVALWRTTEGSRFQNYRARFTVLDEPTISRRWINSIIAGSPDATAAPHAWTTWQKTGKRNPLISTRTIEHRTKKEQMPSSPVEESIVATIRSHFSGRPHSFEYFAATVAKMALPDIVSMDVTRSSRDGGRDAIGKMRIGQGPGSILVDFSLEAKCYSPPNGVGARELSRLISRLRHRQFGVLVTTTWLDVQAYKEIKEDQHPIVVIAAVDIARTIQASGVSAIRDLQDWLNSEYQELR